MTGITEASTTITPTLRVGTPVRLMPAASGLWRVVDGKGRIIGHLETVAQRHGVRYRARRFHAAARAFRDLGDFWSADDAIDCLRFAR